MSLRIAWAGPWNEQSAIAAFGVEVVSALAAAGHRVEVFRTEAMAAVALAPLPAPGPVHAPGRLTPELLSGGFDAVFVNLGNYYAFHGAALATLEATPAILIAHDCVMDGFRHGWLLAGAEATPACASLLAAGNSDDTLLVRLAERAVGAVVHASHYRAPIEAACPGPVVTLPLSMTFQAMCDGLPPPFQVQGGPFVVATIGHLNPNKRVDQVIRAIGASPLLRERVRYLLVGPVEDHYRESLIGVARRVGAPVPEFAGAISDAVLRELLGGVDAICCLREPITEGGSASVILALRSGRPTVVCDHGSYGDLPDDVVLKCPPGREAAHVLHYLETLLEQPALGSEMGVRAQAYAARTFAPDLYAQKILGLAEQVARTLPSLLAERRIAESLRSLNLPSHTSAVQNAMRGLASLLDDKKGLGDGVGASHDNENRTRIG